MSTDRRDSRVRWNMDMDMGGEVERGDGGKVYRCIGRRCDQVSSMRDEERRGGEEAGDVVAVKVRRGAIPVKDGVNTTRVNSQTTEVRTRDERSNPRSGRMAPCRCVSDTSARDTSSHPHPQGD